MLYEEGHPLENKHRLILLNLDDPLKTDGLKIARPLKTLLFNRKI